MKTRYLLQLLGLSALWGSSFVLLRVASPALGPVVLATLRLALATGTLAVIMLLLRHRWPRSHWKEVFGLGILTAALPFLFFSYAALTLPAGYIALFNTTAVLFGTLAAAWLREDTLTWRKLAGCIAGFIGVALIVQLGPVDPTPAVLLAAAAAMAGAGCDSLREAYEPRLQHRGAPKAHSVPSQVAEKSPSSASTAAPATPKARPSQLVNGTRSPPRRDHSASHMGMVVTTMAMSPEPMPNFCASTTMDMAPKAISPPTNAVCRHWAALGQGSP